MGSRYRTRNDTARARLAALVGRLRPLDLDRPVGGGWTVKVTLLHLAFWDRFAAAAVDGWTRSGFTPSADDDGDFVNLAALNDWLVAPPAYALREVVRAAEAADRAADRVGEALHAEIAAGGESWACERGIHRTEHLEQIERHLMNPGLA